MPSTTTFYTVAVKVKDHEEQIHQNAARIQPLNERENVWKGKIERWDHLNSFDI